MGFFGGSYICVALHLLAGLNTMVLGLLVKELVSLLALATMGLIRLQES